MSHYNTVTFNGPTIDYTVASSLAGRGKLAEVSAPTGVASGCPSGAALCERQLAALQRERVQPGHHLMLAPAFVEKARRTAQYLCQMVARFGALVVQPPLAAMLCDARSRLLRRNGSYAEH